MPKGSGWIEMAPKVAGGGVLAGLYVPEAQLAVPPDPPALTPADLEAAEDRGFNAGVSAAGAAVAAVPPR